MARTPKPWWRKDRKSWFVTIVGERYNLGPEKEAAFKLFHELMATSATERKRTSDSVVTVLDRFLDWTKRNRAPRTYDWYLERLQWFTTAPKHFGRSQKRPRRASPKHGRRRLAAIGYFLSDVRVPTPLSPSGFRSSILGPRFP
ncbi:MAG: hypothetical protein AB8G99_16955, partial [Planctomycetaceae bacterium]